MMVRRWFGDRSDRKPRIGVALSGGGVRGLAHLGVLQVLEETGIHVDCVAGTSMGGIVAGLYAAGVPLDDLIAFSTEVGIVDFAARDRQHRGFLGQRKMSRLLADLLGSEDIAFGDLRIPAAVIAADVETGETVVLDDGPLIPALLATSAFPIVFSPVRHQGRWLVDGGVLNNFPVDVVRRLGADRVLGINVPPQVALSVGEANGGREGGRERNPLLRRMREWRLPFLIAETSVGLAAQAANRTRLMLYPPDLLLEVRLPNTGAFSMSKAEEAVQAGRRVAMRHLQALVALKEEPALPRWRRPIARALQRLSLAWQVLWHPERLVYAPRMAPREPQGIGRPDAAIEGEADLAERDTR